MDVAAILVEIGKLYLKKKKIQNLINELNDQLTIIESNLSPNVIIINQIYNEFKNSAYDTSEGTMITYFEDTVALRQERFKIIAKSLETWTEDMKNEEERAQKLLIQTEKEIEDANARLAVEQARLAEQARVVAEQARQTVAKSLPLHK